MSEAPVRTILLLIAITTISTIQGMYFSGCSIQGGFNCGYCDIYCINLDLEANGAIRLPDVALPNSEGLNLFRTRGAISESTLRELPNLKRLTVRESNITDFTPNNLNQLQELLILSSEFAKISSLDCCKNISTLCILGNKPIVIENGAMRDLEKLETLRLSLLKITQLGKSFLEGLESLTFLDINSNSIEEIDEDTFSAVPQLKKLYLEINTNASLKPETFKPLKELRVLNIFGDGLNVLDLGMLQEQKNLTSLGLPTKTWLQLDPDEVIKAFPNLTSFTSDRDSCDEEHERKLDGIFHKLTNSINKNCGYC